MLQRWDPKKSLPKHDFDRKVAEADAYLQLLIEQIKLIEGKKNAAEEDEEKQKTYSAILSQANAMLNSVKHTIVQLQIAKVFYCTVLFFVVIIYAYRYVLIKKYFQNTAIPVNGVYRGPTNSVHVSPPLSHGKNFCILNVAPTSVQMFFTSI